jgi:Protein of unknown function (DUF1579)
MHIVTSRQLTIDSVLSEGAMKRIVWAVCASAAVASAQPAPDPGPRVLDWIGTWQMNADVKASAFGPAGTMSGIDRVERGPGTTVVFHTDATTPGGHVSILATLAYDTVEQAYVYYGVDSTGAITLVRGSVDGRTWTFPVEMHAGGRTIAARNITTFTSPSTYTWTVDVPDADGRDTRFEEGQAAKVATPAAASPTSPAQTSAEQRRLLDWIGTWNVAADVNASPFGPSGKTTGVDRVERGPGDAAAVFHTTLTTPLGTSTSLSTFTYDTVTKAYAFHAIDSVGGITRGRGRVDGKTWTWSTETHVNGQAITGRDVTRFTSASRYTWTFELADASGRYYLIEEGAAQRR